jgi:FkbM family methyltransferase
MKLPFYRTLKQANEIGLARTISAFILIILKKLTVRLKYLPKSAVVEVNGSKMLLFPKKGGIHSELFLHRRREPICTHYLLESGIVRNRDVVLDVGANIGYYVLVESSLVGDKGRVYAVEPVLNNLSILKKNVELNNLTNVSIHQLAMGEQNCNAEIYISKHANLCRMKKYKSGDKIVGTQKVLVETVDTFLEDKQVPNFVRMDVEGYEYEIIKGMPHLLEQDVSLLIELHPMFLSEKMEELFEILKQTNFKVRFAVFEEKIEENPIVRSLTRKVRGDKLPICLFQSSFQELENAITENPDIAPNVFFQK